LGVSWRVLQCPIPSLKVSLSSSQQGAYGTGCDAQDVGDLRIGVVSVAQDEDPGCTGPHLRQDMAHALAGLPTLDLLGRTRDRSTLQSKSPGFLFVSLPTPTGA
jgi:hypothetical protein